MPHHVLFAYVQARVPGTLVLCLFQYNIIIIIIITCMYIIHYVYLGEVLDIGDLVDVTDALKRHDVSNSVWRDLGLHLGILQSTLEDIDDKRRGSPAECMYDVLSCWVERQDKVMERGVPSWNTLVHTLEYVNKAAADSITSEKCKNYIKATCNVMH